MSYGKGNRKFIIFDFDGTIYLQGAFINEVNPIALCILRLLVEQGYVISIITGRHCSQRTFIIDLLMSNGVKISSANFYCRERDEQEVEWKRKVFEIFLERVRNEGSVIYEYHEDNLSVLDFVSRLDKDICLYHYTNGLPVILRKTNRCTSEKMIENCVKEKYGI